MEGLNRNEDIRRGGTHKQVDKGMWRLWRCVENEGSCERWLGNVSEIIGVKENKT